MNGKKRPGMNKVLNKAKKFHKAATGLLSYAKKYNLLIILAFVAAIGSAILSVLGPRYISEMASTISDGVKESYVAIDMGHITDLAIILTSIYLSGLILSYVQLFIMANVSCFVGKGMRGEISAKINRIPLSYFDTHSKGDTLSRVTNDVDTVSQSLNLSIGTIVSASATLLGCTIMMFITEWRMALTAIISSLIGFTATSFIMHKSQRDFVERQNSLAEVNGHIEEYYAGQSIVKAYNDEEKAYEIFKEANERLRKHTFKAECLSGLMKPIMNFIGNFGYVAVCIVGAALAFGGEIDFADVVAFMIYIRLFTSPLEQLGQSFSSLQSAFAASERVTKFLKEEELPDESDKKRLEEVKGKIVFEHVDFAYPGEKTVIEDFSFSIEPGQKVAIVGPTGAGKTTIVNLLMRFYEIAKGSISVDGVPISELSQENLHSLFGVVLQEAWLFKGTVRENILFGQKGISDEEILRICSECGLKHFIDTLPNGLDTILDDNVSISVGQKQLLTIARVMARKAPMLILDEATSSVDTRTEEKIQEAMDSLTKGKTCFVIAHRLSTIENADVIIYMEGGDVKETGTHEELMEKHGLYADLYNSQFVLQ